MSPGGIISPFETKMSRPAKHNIVGIGSKHFASGSLGVIVSGVTSISLLNFKSFNPGCERIRTAYWTLIQRNTTS